MIDSGRKLIGCTVDGNFAHMAAAMLGSLCVNGGVEDATIVVVAHDLKPSQRRQIRSRVEGSGHACVFHDLDVATVAKYSLPVTKAYTAAIYGKLLLPMILSDTVGRLVILDCDMIVHAHISELFSMDMQGQALAAVREHLQTADKRPRRRVNNPDYFNAGLLVVDLVCWNKMNVSQNALSTLREGKIDFIWPEQDALNAVVAGRWVRLGRRWNFYHAGESTPPGLADYDRATIIHFAGLPKPDDPSSHHPARALYREFHPAPTGFDVLDMAYVVRKSLASLVRLLRPLWAPKPVGGRAARPPVPGPKTSTSILRHIVRPTRMWRPQEPIR